MHRPLESVDAPAEGKEHSHPRHASGCPWPKEWGTPQACGRREDGQPAWGGVSSLQGCRPEGMGWTLIILRFLTIRDPSGTMPMAQGNRTQTFLDFQDCKNSPTSFLSQKADSHLAQLKWSEFLKGIGSREQGIKYLGKRITRKLSKKKKVRKQISYQV